MFQYNVVMGWSSHTPLNEKTDALVREIRHTICRCRKEWHILSCSYWAGVVTLNVASGFSLIANMPILYKTIFEHVLFVSCVREHFVVILSYTAAFFMRRQLYPVVRSTIVKIFFWQKKNTTLSPAKQMLCFITWKKRLFLNTGTTIFQGLGFF